MIQYQCTLSRKKNTSHWVYTTALTERSYLHVESTRAVVRLARCAGVGPVSPYRRLRRCRLRRTPRRYSAMAEPSAPWDLRRWLQMTNTCKDHAQKSQKQYPSCKQGLPCMYCDKEILKGWSVTSTKRLLKSSYLAVSAVIDCSVFF